MSSKSMHAFLTNLANRQTDRQTSRGIAFTSSVVGGIKRDFLKKTEQFSYGLY